MDNADWNPSVIYIFNTCHNSLGLLMLCAMFQYKHHIKSISKNFRLRDMIDDLVQDCYNHSLALIVW